MGLGLAGIGALPPDAQGLMLRKGALAGLAQALARVLRCAEAMATTARQEAESLWHQRTAAQMSQAQFIAGLMDRLTGMAQGPATANFTATTPPNTATFPFDYAEVERAVDLLALKLKGGAFGGNGAFCADGSCRSHGSIGGLFLAGLGAWCGLFDIGLPAFALAHRARAHGHPRQ